MKNEIKSFFAALMYFTRIPCPRAWTGNIKYLNRATRYLPLIGWIVGGFAAAVFYLLEYILPKSVSLLFSMLSAIALTGAFHEDGLADVCDAFGGGWKKQQILDIMKDSRIGVYGTLGLVFIILAEFFIVFSMPHKIIPLVIFSGHAISRFSPVLFSYTHQYVRDNDDSKAKPVAKKVSASSLLIAFIIAVLPLGLYRSWWVILVFIPMLIVHVFLTRYFMKRIGGYTGDCLGASVKISEIVYLLSILVLWKFI